MQLRYEINQGQFLRVASQPLMYWASSKVIELFAGTSISNVAYSCKGLDTCDNNSFVRKWYEVNEKSIGFELTDTSKTFSFKWFPYCKGGEYRKWYGNLSEVVLWENDGQILRNLKDENGKTKSRPQNTRFYFKKGLTFNGISSSYRALRYMNHCIFGGGGNGLFSKNETDPFELEALLNSNVSTALFEFLNPSLNFLVGDLLRIPYSFEIRNDKNIIKLSRQNTDASKRDWDSFETSWDFKKHPLI